MSLLRRALMVLPMMAALLFAIPTTPASAVDGGSPRVMVIGDSITQGSAGDWTWRYRLYKHLVGSGVQADMVGPRADLLDNVANTQGNTEYADSAFDDDHNAIWGRSAQAAQSTMQAEVAAARPDYALILLGINDLIYFPATSAETSLRTLITNARRGAPNLKIVLGRILPTTKAMTEPAFATQVSNLNAQIQAIATSMSTSTSPIVVARTDAGFIAADDTYDGIHPNAMGEIKIAAAFADALSVGFGVGSAYPRPLPKVATGPLIAPRLTASAGDALTYLSWTRSPGATGYWVWMRNATSNEPWKSLPFPILEKADLVRTWTGGGLVNGATYQFKFETAKYEDRGVFSNVVDVTPRGPLPAGPVLKASGGDRKATLSWINAAHATNHLVWMRNATTGEAWKKLPTQVTGTSWTAGSLANGASYQFKLQARNGLQEGQYSNVVSVTPTGPAAAGTTLRATAGDHLARLTWTAVTRASSYWVWRRNATAGGDWVRLTPSLTGTSWTNGSLVNGRTYQFKLQSRDAYQDGLFSNVVSVTPKNGR